jgi:thiol-disulfide isomerase/thioredoxin
VVDAGPESATDGSGSIEPGQGQRAGGGEADSEDAVTVRVFDENEFARLLRENQGKVVLVDYWATWCLSCLELFPHTVQLHNRLADRGLAVISVSFDEPEQEAAVLEKLVSKGATFDNFISRYGGSDKSVEAFGLEDGSLPYYQLYDRTGTLRETFQSGKGPIDVDAMDRAVEKLLGES